MSSKPSSKRLHFRAPILRAKCEVLLLEDNLECLSLTISRNRSKTIGVFSVLYPGGELIDNPLHSSDYRLILIVHFTTGSGKTVLRR